VTYHIVSSALSDASTALGSSTSRVSKTKPMSGRFALAS